MNNCKDVIDRGEYQWLVMDDDKAEVCFKKTNFSYQAIYERLCLHLPFVVPIINSLFYFYIYMTVIKEFFFTFSEARWAQDKQFFYFLRDQVLVQDKH